MRFPTSSPPEKCAGHRTPHMPDARQERLDDDGRPFSESSRPVGACRGMTTGTRTRHPTSEHF